MDLPVTMHLEKVFSWRHLSNWSAILVCKLRKFLIQYPCTSSGPGLFLTCFLTFLISIFMLSCTIGSSNSFSTFLSQTLFSLYVTAWSFISAQIRLLSSTSDITLSLCCSSNSLNNLFWFDSNKCFCLHWSVLLSCFSIFAPTASSLC